MWSSIRDCENVGVTDRRATLRVSDHKPVYSGFECDMRTVVAEKQRQVYQEIMRMIDRWENETIPKVTPFVHGSNVVEVTSVVLGGHRRLDCRCGRSTIHGQAGTEGACQKQWTSEIQVPPN